MECLFLEKRFSKYKQMGVTLGIYLKKSKNDFLFLKFIMNA